MSQLSAVGEPDRLPAVARELRDDPQNEPIFIPASLWEVEGIILLTADPLVARYPAPVRKV